jgi:CHASE1-domain containing sensor protein
LPSRWGAWFAVSVWEERLARAKFTDVAGDNAAVLQNGLDEYLSKIVAVRAFYDASHKVGPNEFALFIGRILESHDAIMRITWSPRVTGDERAEFERKVRRRDRRLPDQGLGDERHACVRPAGE